jgi:hypothetical protein
MSMQFSVKIWKHYQLNTATLMCMYNTLLNVDFALQIQNTTAWHRGHVLNDLHQRFANAGQRAKFGPRTVSNWTARHELRIWNSRQQQEVVTL